MDEELKIVLEKLSRREPILPNLRPSYSPQKNVNKNIQPLPGSSKNSDDKKIINVPVKKEPKLSSSEDSDDTSSEESENEVPKKKNSQGPSSEDSDDDTSKEFDTEMEVRVKEEQYSDGEVDNGPVEVCLTKKDPLSKDSDNVSNEEFDNDKVPIKKELKDSDDDFDEFENGVEVGRRKRKPKRYLSDDDYSNEELDNKIKDRQRKRKPRKYSSKEPDVIKPRRPSFLSPVSENGNACKYSGMRSKQLRLLLKSDKVIQFCQENGLISKTVTCSCGNPMKLANKRTCDGCGWICYERCHEVRPDQTIRKGTWFECSKLGISDILWIAYMWVYEYSCMSMLHECDHSNRTVIGWCTSCQGFCKEIIKFKKEPIGGEGRTVEVFKRKVADEPHWTLCAIEYDSTNTLHIEVNDDNPVTLMKIFNQYFLPKTKVVARNWSFIGDLSLQDFIYLTMEKCLLFYDLVQKEIMSDFEAIKIRICRAPIQDEWSNLEHSPSFYEKMYRKSLSFSSDAFLTFLKDITLIYKPLNTLMDTK